MNIVALIPARGGSKRIPRKNLQEVGGITLLERAILTTKRSRHITATSVSSEDPKIQGIALACGAAVIERPLSLAQDETRMEEVVADFLSFSGLCGDDIMMLLEPTAALRTSADLDLIADLMILTGAPAARIVHSSRIACHGHIYRDAGLASAIRVGSFKDCLFPEGTLLVHHADDRGIDIDTEGDLERARALA